MYSLRMVGRMLLSSIFLIVAIGSVYAQSTIGSTYYDGLRLNISSCVTKVRGDKGTIECNITNTGREAIDLSNVHTLDKIFIETTDETNEKLVPFGEEALVTFLNKQKLTINPGQIISAKSVKVALAKPSSQEPIVQNTQVPTPSPSAAPAPPVVKATEKQSKEKVEVATPVATVETTRESTQHSATPPKEAAKPPIQKATKPAPPVVPKVVETSSKKEEAPAAPTAMESESGCYDIVVDKAEIINKKRRSVKVRATLLNTGERTFVFDGKNPGSLDNLGFRLYFSSVAFKTRGSLLAGGVFFRDTYRNTQLAIPSGKRTEIEFTVDLDKHSKFTPILLMEWDPFLVISECNEQDNTFSVIVQ